MLASSHQGGDNDNFEIFQDNDNSFDNDDSADNDDNPVDDDDFALLRCI